MDLTSFLQMREERKRREPVYRNICMTCRQPDFSCYCAFLRPIKSQIEFTILIHPIEMHRRIATGRMSHLSLKNSRLILGHDFTHNDEVNALLADPRRRNVMLYPGIKSLNITPLSVQERRALAPQDRILNVLVIDGTWGTAKKMVNSSLNLRGLERICFTPSRPSTFRVRKQPRKECYSTIEAIHQTLELFDDGEGERDHLLYIFDKMVNRQLELAHGLDAMARSFTP